MLNFLLRERVVIASLVGFGVLFMWANSGVGFPSLERGEVAATTGGGIDDSLHFPDQKPEDLPADVQQIRQQLIDNHRIDHNGDLLLYRTTAYEIEYITGFDFFFVNITRGNPDEMKLDAEKWFLEQGLAQEDLCDLPVRFLIREPALYDAFPGFTTLPNGCEA